MLSKLIILNKCDLNNDSSLKFYLPSLIHHMNKNTPKVNILSKLLSTGNVNEKFLKVFEHFNNHEIKLNDFLKHFSVKKTNHNKINTAVPVLVHDFLIFIILVHAIL